MVVFMAKRFIKWVGSKLYLLKEIKANLPSQYTRWIEPFLGSGVVVLDNEPGVALLNDINSNLIECFEVVRDNVEELIVSLQKHRYERDYFMQLRNLDRTPAFSELNKIERASRFIFINKTCFNGLMRGNKKGELNCAFGRYNNPKWCVEEELRETSKLLQGYKFFDEDFEVFLEMAQKGDFVYLDPPYLKFNHYNSEFDLSYHIRLSECVKKLNEKGVNFMLSHCENKKVEELYSSFKKIEVITRRTMNPLTQGVKKEFLFVNY